MSLRAPLAVTFFPPEVSESSDKEGNSLLVFLILHSVLTQGIVGIWSTRGSSNFTEATALQFTWVFSSERIK